MIELVRLSKQWGKYHRSLHVFVITVEALVSGHPRDAKEGVRNWSSPLTRLGRLRNHDGNANVNFTWKYKFALLVLLRDYSNLFYLHNVAELSSNRTGGNGVQVAGGREGNIYRHVLTYSTKPWISSFHVVVWPSTANKMYQINNSRAGPLFSSLNPIVLWRSRCRRRRSFLNSLMVLVSGH